MFRIVPLVIGSTVESRVHYYWSRVFRILTGIVHVWLYDLLQLARICLANIVEFIFNG